MPIFRPEFTLGDGAHERRHIAHGAQAKHQPISVAGHRHRSNDLDPRPGNNTPLPSTPPRCRKLSRSLAGAGATDMTHLPPEASPTFTDVTAAYRLSTAREN